MAINLKRVASALLSAVTGAALMASARTEEVAHKERCAAYRQYPLTPRVTNCPVEAASPYDF